MTQLAVLISAKLRLEAEVRLQVLVLISLARVKRETGAHYFAKPVLPPQR
jgi:hypothetical protein